MAISTSLLISKRHGLPKVTLHSLRHTNATLMIAEGVDFCTVSKRLGHANTSITLDVYAHALKTRDSDAADKLDEARRLVAETMRDSQDYPIFTEREISRLKEMKVYLGAIADRLRMVDEAEVVDEEV